MSEKLNDNHYSVMPSNSVTSLIKIPEINLRAKAYIVVMLPEDVSKIDIPENNCIKIIAFKDFLNKPGFEPHFRYIVFLGNKMLIPKQFITQMNSRNGDFPEYYKVFESNITEVNQMLSMINDKRSKDYMRDELSIRKTEETAVTIVRNTLNFQADDFLLDVNRVVNILPQPYNSKKLILRIACEMLSELQLPITDNFFYPAILVAYGANEVLTEKVVERIVQEASSELNIHIAFEELFQHVTVLRNRSDWKTILPNDRLPSNGTKAETTTTVEVFQQNKQEESKIMNNNEGTLKELVQEESNSKTLSDFFNTYFGDDKEKFTIITKDNVGQVIEAAKEAGFDNVSAKQVYGASTQARRRLGIKSQKPIAKVKKPRTTGKVSKPEEKLIEKIAPSSIQMSKQLITQDEFRLLEFIRLSKSENVVKYFELANSDEVIRYKELTEEFSPELQEGLIILTKHI